MMNSGFLKTSTLLTVAVGAGVMIGAAGVFLYEHLIKEKRRLILQQDVMRLGMSMTELRRELEELREAQMARRRSRRATREEHNSTASVSESEVDMMSIVDDEDEFFDFSDAEDYPFFGDSSNTSTSERSDGSPGPSAGAKKPSAFRSMMNQLFCLHRKKNKQSPDGPSIKSISVVVDVYPNRKNSIVNHAKLKTVTGAKVSANPQNRRMTVISTSTTASLRTPKSSMSMGHMKSVGRMRTLSAVVSRDWHELKRDYPDNKCYKHIDDKLSNPDLSVKMEAYDELKRLRNANHNDPEILWRLAKACHGIGVIKGITDGLDVKKTYIDEAVLHASDCLERAPRSAEAHKWYAITVGSRGEFQPTKNKIKDGFVFKEHIEEALKISPNDPTLLHLLGRFRYEVATLSWVERKVANAVFGEVPYSTFPEALEALLRVEELNKDPWKENRLMVAKCYINMGEFSEAVVWLDMAQAVDPRSLEDARMQTEIQELLGKYERYRNKDKDKHKPKKS